MSLSFCSQKEVSDFRFGLQMREFCHLGEREVRRVRAAVSESWSANGWRRKHKHVCDGGEPIMTFFVVMNVQLSWRELWAA